MDKNTVSRGADFGVEFDVKLTDSRSKTRLHSGVQ